MTSKILGKTIKLSKYIKAKSSVKEKMTQKILGKILK